MQTMETSSSESFEPQVLEDYYVEAERLILFLRVGLGAGKC